MSSTPDPCNATREASERPKPVHPEAFWRGPFDPNGLPYEPAAFDGPALRAPDDVPEVLRGWVCDAIEVVQQLAHPGGRYPDSPRERVLSNILCDVRQVAEDAAAVLEGHRPPPWEALPEESRAEIRAAGRELLGLVEPSADEAGAVFLALRSLGLHDEAAARRRPAAPRPQSAHACARCGAPADTVVSITGSGTEGQREVRETPLCGAHARDAEAACGGEPDDETLPRRRWGAFTSPFALKRVRASLAAGYVLQKAEEAGDDVPKLLADLPPEEIARRLRGDASDGEGR